MTEIQREFRPSLVQIFSKTTVFSIEDLLNIDQIKLSISGIGEKRGVIPYVFCYIDIDEAYSFAEVILSGRFADLFPASGSFGDDKVIAKWEKMGGTPHSDRYNGQPESRIVEIQGLQGPKGLRFVVALKTGPGKLNDIGGISPLSGDKMLAQRVFFTLDQFRMMMLKVRRHINAYEAYHLPALYDERGNRSKNRDDCFKTGGNRKAQRDHIEEPVTVTFTSEEEAEVNDTTTYGPGGIIV
jgi:hypothetical protein